MDSQNWSQIFPSKNSISIWKGHCVAIWELFSCPVVLAPSAALQLPCCIIILYLTELLLWSLDVALGVMWPIHRGFLTERGGCLRSLKCMFSNISLKQLQSFGWYNLDF